ncbi:unnamed protein product [Anisakis simplex]|uniref:Uncharacterized protein n=1 Tax=Anisakis simplex TaxID=6269 RepID=A0A3P6NPJ8_ANISI|nr:unnamed protein product [Anisakis simplex]
MIIMYGKGGGVRTLFALHACLALGGCIAPLMSAPFVFNSVRTGTLPTNPLMSIDINGHHAVNKRHITGIEALNATGIDDQMTNSSELIASAVESPKRSVDITARNAFSCILMLSFMLWI